MIGRLRNSSRAKVKNRAVLLGFIWVNGTYNLFM